jgi:type IV pilus assembly protein PilA
MLNNIKSKNRGFTIVELLIVIVVIAILAAITIVAYNGIQNRAKDSSAQALGNNVIKKVEAYFTINSAYPTLTELDSNYAPGATVAGGGGAESKLDTSTAAATQATAPTNETTVQYRKCATPDGAAVTYWQTSGTVTKYLGSATSSSTCS